MGNSDWEATASRVRAAGLGFSFRQTGIGYLVELSLAPEADGAGKPTTVGGVGRTYEEAVRNLANCLLQLRGELCSCGIISPSLPAAHSPAACEQERAYLEQLHGPPKTRESVLAEALRGMPCTCVGNPDAPHVATCVRRIAEAALSWRPPSP